MSVTRIEVFSCGKTHAAPQDNEDAFVLFPDRLYAVIDGATDRSGSRYNGMFAGRYAATLVKQTIEEMFLRFDGKLPDFAALLHAINDKIQAAYQTHGILEKARANATFRFTAALALIEQTAESLHIHTIGDCGIRINGTQTIRMGKDLDHITALLRQAGWRHLETLPLDAQTREQASRRLCMRGLDFLEDEDRRFFDAAALTRIRDSAFAQVQADLPHVPVELITHLLRHGIIHGQHVYQNCTNTCLGYAAIDGFDIPMPLVGVSRIPLAGVDRIELFSDGYFDSPDGFGVAMWEESHRSVEAQDPAKVRLWLGPKGSTTSQWTDDRTYLGILRG
jgi:Cu/Zn superoxide dismutase